MGLLRESRLRKFLEGKYFPLGEVSLLNYSLKSTRMAGLGATDESSLAAHAQKLDATLAVYETILSQHKYLAGDELSLADLYHLPYGKMARELGYKQAFDKHPAVKKWIEGLEARQSWKDVIGNKA